MGDEHLQTQGAQPDEKHKTELRRFLAKLQTKHMAQPPCSVSGVFLQRHLGNRSKKAAEHMET